jgi:hypothetical protein
VTVSHQRDDQERNTHEVMLMATQARTHARGQDPRLFVDDRDVAVVTTTSEGTGVRWGPIVAGFLSALGLFLLLTLLAVAIGAATVTPDGSAPAMVATVVASVIALFTFFAGGFIAAWSGRVVDQARGALSGFLVWALWSYCSPAVLGSVSCSAWRGAC